MFQTEYVSWQVTKKKREEPKSCWSLSAVWVQPQTQWVSSFPFIFTPSLPTWAHSSPHCSPHCSPDNFDEGVRWLENRRTEKDGGKTGRLLDASWRKRGCVVLCSGAEGFNSCYLEVKHFPFLSLITWLHSGLCICIPLHYCLCCVCFFRLSVKTV